MGWSRCIVLVLVLGTLGEEAGEQDTLTEGLVEEDMTQYTRSAMAAMTMSMTPLSRDGAILYKVLWKPRHCAGPYTEGDTVMMNM